MSHSSKHPRLHFDAVIFDMDGVVTNTAKLHARAWKQLFDDYLQRRSAESQQAFVPFDIKSDYLTYVDGKPRYEGVRSFIAARGIDLPDGDPSDGAGTDTICGLGNAKDEIFERLLHQYGPEVFDTTVALIGRLKGRGVKVGIVTSSKHCQDVLQMAGLDGLFAARVDGVSAESLGLRGKPDPDIFLKAGELLGVTADRTVVVEDAVSGVQAGRRGHFALVLGVDRGHNRSALTANGADIVVSDLGEVTLEQIENWFAAALPSALARRAEIARRLHGRQAAVFLDYDGTLTPIAPRPDLALMTPAMREAVRALAHCCTMAIVSGRALTDVAKLVDLAELYYAGNHGFEITGPDHTDICYEPGKRFLSAVNDVSRRIEAGIDGIEGAFVENKAYSLSVHYRLAAREHVPKVERVVDEVLASFPALAKRHGKEVFEIRPRIDWDKGKAVLWLLEALQLNGPAVLPIYVGDDVTDEDAFAALKGRGIGVLVADAPRPSSADYSLRDVGEVKQFLEMLATLTCARRS
jgi:trehalose 6-phosphate phosphatase